MYIYIYTYISLQILKAEFSLTWENTNRKFRTLECIRY